ncbi:endo alpha-1,4 polygalactosaminidase [bacterium]|nr:endo alpha-1,4 polygalactosaminidase [bacterium]
MIFRNMIDEFMSKRKKRLKFDINYSEAIKITDDYDLYFISPFAEISGDIRKAVAYISLTEINENSQYFSDLPKDMLLKKNQKWNSFLVDITRPEWWKVIVNTVEFAKSLGFKNYFIDNVDGVESLLKKNTGIEKRIDEIFNYIRKNTENHLYINRGFIIYDRINHIIDGVMMEGFFFNRNENSWRHLNLDEIKWRDSWVKILSHDNKFIFAVDYADISQLDSEDTRLKALDMSVVWIHKDELLQ